MVRSSVYTRLAQIVRILKFVLGSQKFVFSLYLCNKVPYILMESYYYYLLSICFDYVFYLHMLCIKVYRKTSVGGDTP